MGDSHILKEFTLDQPVLGVMQTHIMELRVFAGSSTPE
jgi:hypothetical protein